LLRGTRRTCWGRLYDLIRLNFAIFPGIRQFRSADFLHTHYERRQKRQGFQRIFLNTIIFVVFYLWVPLRTRRVANDWKKDQAWVQRTVQICRARFVDPLDVALFRIEEEPELDHYMRRFEHISVGRAVAQPDTDHSPYLTDKLRLYELLGAVDAPHPRLFAIAGRCRREILVYPQLNQELFIKPTQGSGGAGAFAFSLTSAEGPAKSFDRLVDEIARSRGLMIVQERLQVHSSIADIALNALPTVRLITLLDENGTPEIVSSVIRLAATPAAVIDNIGAGGLSAPIEMKTGKLGLACGGMRPGEYERHPVSVGLITGRVLPNWHEICSLAVSLHGELLGDHVLIGWDIAPTDRGPCVIEANARPSIIMAQRATRTPVGRTRMGELLEFHLAKR
jgi:hypothetical protein